MKRESRCALRFGCIGPIYVLDAANQEIVALSWDRNNNRAEIIGYRNLDDDTKFMQRPR